MFHSVLVLCGFLRKDAEDESVNTTSMISVEEWSPDQVCTWMKHIGFPQYAQNFVGEVIHFHRTYKVTTSR